LVVAYVLISTEIGAEGRVLDRLQEFPEIEEAYIIYGIYDILVKINLKDESKLRETVTKIRRIEGVKSTLTIQVVRGFTRKAA